MALVWGPGAEDTARKGRTTVCSSCCPTTRTTHSSSSHTPRASAGCVRPTANGLDAAKLASSFDSAEGTKRLEAYRPFAALGAFDNAATAMRQSPSASRSCAPRRRCRPRAGRRWRRRRRLRRSQRRRRRRRKGRRRRRRRHVRRPPSRATRRLPRAARHHLRVDVAAGEGDARTHGAAQAVDRAADQCALDAATRSTPSFLCDLRTELAGFAAHVTFCVRPSDAPPAGSPSLSSAPTSAQVVREQLAVFGAPTARLHRAACPLATSDATRLCAPRAADVEHAREARGRVETRHSLTSPRRRQRRSRRRRRCHGGRRRRSVGDWAVSPSFAMTLSTHCSAPARRAMASRGAPAVARARPRHPVAAARRAERGRRGRVRAVEEISSGTRRGGDDGRGKAAAALRRPSGRRQRRLLSSRHSTPSPPSRAPSVPPPRRRPRPTRPRCGPSRAESARPRDLRGDRRGGRRLPPRRRSTTAAAARRRPQPSRRHRGGRRKNTKCPSPRHCGGLPSVLSVLVGIVNFMSVRVQSPLGTALVAVERRPFAAPLPQLARRDGEQSVMCEFWKRARRAPGSSGTSRSRRRGGPPSPSPPGQNVLRRRTDLPTCANMTRRFTNTISAGDSAMAFEYLAMAALIIPAWKASSPSSSGRDVVARADVSDGPRRRVRVHRQPRVGLEGNPPRGWVCA